MSFLLNENLPIKKIERGKILVKKKKNKYYAAASIKISNIFPILHNLVERDKIIV